MEQLECRGADPAPVKLPIKIIRFLGAIPVFLYQLLLKPFLPKSCAFYPTCSEYALIAIRERGIFVGWWLAVKRILRCNPFNRNGFGYDPVPPRKRKHLDTQTETGTM